MQLFRTPSPFQPLPHTILATTPKSAPFIFILLTYLNDYYATDSYRNPSSSFHDPWQCARQETRESRRQAVAYLSVKGSGKGKTKRWWAQYLWLPTHGQVTSDSQASSPSSLFTLFLLFFPPTSALSSLPLSSFHIFILNVTPYVMKWILMLNV